MHCMVLNQISEYGQVEELRRHVNENGGYLMDSAVCEEEGDRGEYIWKDTEYNKKTGRVLTYCELYEKKFPNLKKMIQYKKYIQHEIYDVFGSLQ